MESRFSPAITNSLQLIGGILGGILGSGIGYYCAFAYAVAQANRFPRSNSEDPGFLEFFGLSLLIGVPLAGIVGVCVGYWIASRLTRKYRDLLDESA